MGPKGKEQGTLLKESLGRPLVVEHGTHEKRALSVGAKRCKVTSQGHTEKGWQSRDKDSDHSVMLSPLYYPVCPITGVEITLQKGEVNCEPL